MANKFKKIDKEFQLTDSSLNVYSFRLLTSGYLIDEFKKNPIGYLMHERDKGVCVRWEDLRVEGDKVFAKPVINLSNPLGQAICDDIENGFLNAASVGNIVALELSYDPQDMVPGQEGPTVTKWFNRECSIVDVPGNFNSLALYDKDGKLINLADFKHQSNKMKQLFLTPEQISKLALKADPTQQDVDVAINDLLDKVKKFDTVNSQLTQALADKKKAEDDLALLKKDTTEKTVANLIATALTDGKITKEAGDKLKVDYAANPEGLKNLIDALPKYQSIVKQLEDNAGKSVDDLKSKTWSELDKAGKLEDLKAKDINSFKEKYKQEFGKEYQG